MIQSLLMDPEGEENKTLESNQLSENNEDFEEEQILVAKLINLVQNEDLELNFKLLNKIRKKFGLGGKWRLRHTLPSIIFSTFKLIKKYGLDWQNIVNFKLCFLWFLG